MPRSASTRPLLWTCPRCGKSYVTRNLWHSCVVMPAEAHFVDRPRSRKLFDALLRFLEREGPVTVSVSKTRIEFMTRVRFAGVQVRRDYLRLAFWLKRCLDSPRLARVEHYGGDDWGHFLVVRDEADLDDELAAWLRESRAIGDQLHRGLRRLQESHRLSCCTWCDGGSRLRGRPATNQGR